MSKSTFEEEIARKGKLIYTNISDSHIIGVLTGIIHNGNTISVNDKKYRLYVHL